MNKFQDVLAAILATASLALASATHAQPIEIKIADTFPKGHVVYDNIVSVMIPALEEGGKIKVKYFPANQLGNMGDMVELMRSGVVDIGYMQPGIVSGRLPVTSIMALPGGCTTAEEFERLLRRMVAGPLKQEYDKLGIKAIVASGTPPYEIFTRTKPVRVPADAKGLKLRGGGGDADDFMRDAGINVISMQSSQMYESLQKGVLDGVAYLHATAPSQHLEEVTKQATEGAPLMCLMGFYFVDQKKFDSWPADIQAIVASAGLKMGIAYAKDYDRREAEGKKVFRAAGGTINTLTAAEKQAWLDAAKDAPEKLIKKLEARGFTFARSAYAELQKIRAEVK